MKKKHLFIFIGQSIAIALFAVYAYVQQSTAKTAKRETEYAKVMAEEARRQAEEARRQQVLCEGLLNKK